jgi:hypothetical protein
LKVPTQKGGIWVVATVRDILINPAYNGKIRWKWRPQKKTMTDGEIIIERPRARVEEYILIDGLHEAIIAPDVFAKAQEMISQNPPRPVGEKHVVKNPLAGLLRCGKCGRSMSRRPYQSGYPDTILCAIPECSNVSSHFSIVENRVIEALKEWLQGYKLDWNLDTAPKKKATKNPQLELRRKALKQADTEIEILNAQIGKTHDLLEQGIYDTNMFLDRTRELGERKRQAEFDRAALEEDLEIEQMREESRINIVPKVEHLIAVYHELPTPQAKNDLLKDVLERIEYIKERGNRWHGSTDDFELAIFPRLPAALKNTYL